MAISNRPNIVFILIDDLGWRDLGCTGSSFYETPRLDRLAAEGMRFTQAYASCPVCSPTRASILTGRYPARVGVTNYIYGQERGRLLEVPYLDHLPLEETCLARPLSEAGYQTWHVGKWHLGKEPFYPDKHGFDVNVGGCGWGHPKYGYFTPYQIPGLSDGPEDEYLTDRLTDEAIRLIHGSDGRPFFLNFCHYAVHTPIQAPAADVARFEAKARSLGLDQAKILVEGEAFPCEHKKSKRVVRRIVQSDPTYAAMVWNLDWNIGRLLDALDEAGLRDNTMVVFTSDNGGLATAEGSPTSNAPLAEGKGWMYEGGTREPLIVRWPGVVAPGAVSDAVTTSPDFYPTLLEVAGHSPMPEQHCDGVSMVGALKGGAMPAREAIYWHYPHYGNQGGTPGCSMRAGDYKLIEFFETGCLELYNLREDESETRNLAGEKPELAQRLHKTLVAWRESVEAKIPARNPDFQPWPGREWD